MSFFGFNPSGQSVTHVSPAEIKKPLFSSAPKAHRVGNAPGAQTVALPPTNPFAATIERQRAIRQQALNAASGTPAPPANISSVPSVGPAKPAQFISGGKLRRTHRNTRRHRRSHTRRHTRSHTRRHTHSCKHNKHRRSRR